MRIIMALIFWSLAVVHVSADESVAALAAQADWPCVRFQVIGVCRRHSPPFVGAKVRYWQPVLLVETTQRSGVSGIMEFKSVVAAVAGERAEASMCGAAGQADTTSLHLNEVHVFGFPFSDAFSLMVEAPCEGLPDLGSTICYLSEQDRDEWRRARYEMKHPLAQMTAKAGPVCERYGAFFPGLCLGAWGPLYPRTGFVVHTSPATASAVAAFRAVDIAALKPQTPHQVISPVLFWPDVRSDRLQLVSPVRRRCMAVGADPAFWDNGVSARDGRFVWIYWRKKECCLF